MKQAWSHTALATFKTCPRQYEAKYVTKEVVFKDTPATLLGKKVHKALEDAIGSGVVLAKDMKQYQPIVDFIMAKPADERHCELKVGIKEDGAPCDFFDKKVWCRGVLDLLIIHGDTAWVIDYKTGKQKSDPDQLKLFAVFVFAKFPKVKNVRAMYIWVAVDAVDADTFTPDDIDAIWDHFDPDLTRLSEAQRVGVFTPTPNGLCKEWCDVVRCENHGKSARR